MGKIISADDASGAEPLVRLQPGMVLPADLADMVHVLTRLRESAREAGRADAVREVLGELRDALAEIERRRTALLADAEREILGLAVRVAERIIHAEIGLDPSVLTELVADARGAIGGRDRVTLYAGARAFSMLREQLVLPDVELREDPLESPWSMRMETHNSALSFGLERQLEAIETALIANVDR